MMPWKSVSGSLDVMETVDLLLRLTKQNGAASGIDTSPKVAQYMILSLEILHTRRHKVSTDI